MFGVREDSGLCLQKWPVQGVASSPPFNLYISAQKNSFDIERFIVTELDRVISQKQLLRGKVSGKLRQQIMDPLSNRANGMYGGETIPLTDVRLQLT